MRTACVNGVAALFLAFVVVLVPALISRADVNRPVIDAGKKATALVEIYDGDKLKGWASAFCIDKSGIFITNHHVAVTGTKNNKLTLVLDAGTPNQKSLKATVLKADAESDLAVLHHDKLAHTNPWNWATRPASAGWSKPRLSSCSVTPWVGLSRWQKGHGLRRRSAPAALRRCVTITASCN